jgi:branched-chain amino acid transport system substrate-binding protein
VQSQRDFAFIPLLIFVPLLQAVPSIMSIYPPIVERMFHEMGRIPIAIVTPKSFDRGVYGVSALLGAELAIKHINARPDARMRGRKLWHQKYSEEKHSRSKLTPIKHRRKLVDDGHKFVIGHPCSDEPAYEASKLYEKEGVLMITPSATRPLLTTRGHKLLFRAVGTDDKQASVVCDWIARNVKPSAKIAVLHDEQSYGIASAVRHGLKEKGLPVVFPEHIPSFTMDHSPTIEYLAQNEIDFVYYAGWGRELCWLLRRARDQGCNVPFMSSDAAAISQMWFAGPAAEGLVVTSPGHFNELEHHRAMTEEAMGGRANIPSPSAFFRSYAAVQVLVQGIAATGFSFDTGKIAEAIRAGTFDTTAGSLSFQPNGDLASPEFVVQRCHWGEGGVTWSKA